MSDTINVKEVSIIPVQKLFIAPYISGDKDVLLNQLSTAIELPLLQKEIEIDEDTDYNNEKIYSVDGELITDKELKKVTIKTSLAEWNEGILTQLSAYKKLDGTASIGSNQYDIYTFNEKVDKFSLFMTDENKEVILAYYPVVYTGKEKRKTEKKKINAYDVEFTATVDFTEGKIGFKSFVKKSGVIPIPTSITYSVSPSNTVDEGQSLTINITSKHNVSWNVPSGFITQSETSKQIILIANTYGSYNLIATDNSNSSNNVSISLSVISNLSVNDFNIVASGQNTENEIFTVSAVSPNAVKYITLNVIGDDNSTGSSVEVMIGQEVSVPKAWIGTSRQATLNIYDNNHVFMKEITGITLPTQV